MCIVKCEECLGDLVSFAAITTGHRYKKAMHTIRSADISSVSLGGLVCIPWAIDAESSSLCDCFPFSRMPSLFRGRAPCRSPRKSLPMNHRISHRASHCMYICCDRVRAASSGHCALGSRRMFSSDVEQRAAERLVRFRSHSIIHHAAALLPAHCARCTAVALTHSLVCAAPPLSALERGCGGVARRPNSRPGGAPSMAVYSSECDGAA